MSTLAASLLQEEFDQALDRPQCGRSERIARSVYRQGRCHTCAGMGKRSRVSVPRRILCASALVTTEITVMEWEGLLRRRLITTPPRAARNAPTLPSMQNLLEHQDVISLPIQCVI